MFSIAAVCLPRRFPTPEEPFRLLEQAFQDSYNRLAFVICDDKQRRIIEVELQLSDQIFPEQSQREDDSTGSGRLLRGLQTDINNETTYVTFNQTANATNTTGYATLAPILPQSTVFAVRGQCRNCMVSDTGGFPLFVSIPMIGGYVVDPTPAPAPATVLLLGLGIGLLGFRRRQANAV